MRGNELLNILENIDSTYIEAAEQAPKKKRHTLIKWVPIAVCLVLAIVGMGIIIPILSNQASPDVETCFQLPDAIDKICWSKEKGNSLDANVGWVSWNGWKMNYELLDALIQLDEDTYIAIEVFKENQANVNQFQHNGKTVAQIKTEIANLREFASNLDQFHKDGEYLKYGELLYSTGTPDGERWTKELYESTIAKYDDIFFSKYIINGEVQHDKLTEDASSCRSQATHLSNELNIAYLEYYKHDNMNDNKNMVKEFEKKGVCSVIKNGHLIIFVKKEEFAKLKNQDRDYVLYLAKRSLFEDSVDPGIRNN